MFVNEAIDIGAELFGVPKDMIKSKTRKRKYILPKKIMSYVLTKEHGVNISRVAKEFNRSRWQIMLYADSIESHIYIEDVYNRIEKYKEAIHKLAAPRKQMSLGEVRDALNGFRTIEDAKEFFNK